jgi:hypothetical protein
MSDADLPRPPARGPVSRRRYAAASGVVVVALVAGGVVASRGSPPRSSVQTLDAAPLDVVPDDAEPSGSAEPSAPPSPTPSPTPSGTPAAGTTSPIDVAPEPEESPTPTGMVIDPGMHRPPTTPPATPLIVVEVSDASLPTATKMLVTVRWRTARGRYAETDPGDGHPPWTSDACYHGDRDVEYGHEWAVATYEWSYRRAGAYDITAELKSHPCGGAGQIETVAHAQTVRVHVTQGADVANGPWEPHLQVSWSDDAPPDANPDNPPYMVWGGSQTWESDGWLWKVVTDFGDGSEPETSGGYAEDCNLEGKPYPDSTWPWGGQGGSYGHHTMPGPGTYTITTTAYSSACGGGDVQTVTKVVTVTVAS